MLLVLIEGLSAGRALLLCQNGSLDALLAENVTTDSRCRFRQLIHAYWAGELWFLWDLLHRFRWLDKHW